MVLFTNNCQNEYEKQVFFKCSQKPQIRRCSNKTFCDDSSILSFFKTGNFKVGGSVSFLGGTGGKIGPNVENDHFLRA